MSDFRDAFRAFSHLQFETTDSNDPADDDETEPIILLCKMCGKGIQRSQGTGVWVHSDDEVIFHGTRIVSFGDYDHQPVLDVIDVAVVDSLDT